MTFREEDFLRISSCLYSARSPLHQSHVYGMIKISRTVFEKGHQRNIPVKEFQNLTSGFREKRFLGISSYLYSARSPHSPEPCYWTDQNFANNFIISKSDQHFQRFLKNCLKNSISLP